MLFCCFGWRRKPRELLIPGDEVDELPYSPEIDLTNPAQSQQLRRLDEWGREKRNYRERNYYLERQALRNEIGNQQQQLLRTDTLDSNRREIVSKGLHRSDERGTINHQADKQVQVVNSAASSEVTEAQDVQVRNGRLLSLHILSGCFESEPRTEGRNFGASTLTLTPDAESSSLPPPMEMARHDLYSEESLRNSFFDVTDDFAYVLTQEDHDEINRSIDLTEGERFPSAADSFVDELGQLIRRAQEIPDYRSPSPQVLVQNLDIVRSQRDILYLPPPPPYQRQFRSNGNLEDQLQADPLVELNHGAPEYNFYTLQRRSHQTVQPHILQNYNQREDLTSLPPEETRELLPLHLDNGYGTVVRKSTRRNIKRVLDTNNAVCNERQLRSSSANSEIDLFSPTVPRHRDRYAGSGNDAVEPSPLVRQTSPVAEIYFFDRAQNRWRIARLPELDHVDPEADVPANFDDSASSDNGEPEPSLSTNGRTPLRSRAGTSHQSSRNAGGSEQSDHGNTQVILISIALCCVLLLVISFCFRMVVVGASDMSH